MSVLKVRCPECDASIRQTIADSKNSSEVALECPKCGNEFTAALEQKAAEPTAKKKPRKSPRPVELDDDEQAPRKKKKKSKQGSNVPLIAGGIGAALLLIGGVVAAVLMYSGPKNKPSETDSTVKAETPAPSSAKPDAGKPQPPGKLQPPGPTGPLGPSGPGSSGPSGPKPPATVVPNRPNGPSPAPAVPGAPPGGVASHPGAPSTTSPSAGSGSTATPPSNQQANSGTPKKNKVEEANLPSLPPPPKLRLNSPGGLMGGTMITTERANPTPPLLPDEDPFFRAKSFRSEGKVPPLPKLPPANQRPSLALDSGGHTSFVQNVFITNAGDRCVTVADDKTVRVWDIKKATTLNTFRFPSGTGSEGSLQAAALSSKGKLAVSGIPLTPAKAGAQPVNVIFIVNVETGALLKTITAASVVFSLSFSSDGSRLAAGCANGTVQVFDANTGAQVGRDDSPRTGPIYEVRFSPETKSMVLGILSRTQSSKLIRVVDLKNPAHNVTFNATTADPVSIAWSNDARFVAAGGQSGEILIYDVGNKKEARRFPARKIKNQVAKISQLQFLDGDTSIVCGGLPQWAAIIGAESGKVRKEFGKHSNTVTAVCASADGKLVATCGGDQNEVYVWNPSTGQEVARLSGAGKGIWGIGWSNDGKAIGWGTTKNTEDVHDNCPLEQIFRLDDMGPGGPAFQMKFQQAQTTDETFTILKTPVVTDKGQVTYALSVQVGQKQPYGVIIPNEHIFSVSVLPGRGKAVIGGGQGLYLFDLQTKEHKSFNGASGSILSVAPSPDGHYFVTGSSDQTIRIWKPEEEEPVLSIFPVGRDWIAWSPQGYYACSPHGEQLLAWQVNSGINRMPQVYPAARFRPSMYQPAIIKYLIPAGTTSLAMAMAQKFDQALAQTSSVADVMPPEASFDEEITKETVIDQDIFTVKASARGTAKQPITTMRLMVDGRPFQGLKGIKRFETPAEVAETAWTVPVSPGPHTFAVIAETPVSKGMSRPLTITRKGDVPRPNLYVLAMGINDYPGKLKLTYSATDADYLANALKNHCKGVFGKIEIRVLKDKQATLKGMQEGLDWLGSKMTAQDVGIVSFSGHGTRDKDNRFYLVSQDFNPEDTTHTCFSGAEFKARLDNMPGRLITILDACHSGDVAERVSPASSDSLVQDLSSEDSGVIVMCASLGRELSHESSLTKAGFFTLALVEGLEGHADVDEDGVIMINELDMYATYRVNQISQGTQHSSTNMPAGMRPFALATVPKSAKPQ